MKKSGMNSHGFNLFTALVSFLFITLTVLLWQSMIQSERKTSDMFRASEDRMKIEAIADNSVTDAIQTFNYSLRKQTVDYASKNIGGDFFFEMPEENKWGSIINSFVVTHFGDPNGNNQQFANAIAGDLLYYFANSWNFKTYGIKTENAQDRAKLTAILKSSVNNAISDNSFFSVVGCRGGNPHDCPLGTFYVNLDFTKLSPEEYELLPRIVVTNYATHDEIRQVILPKENFRIYVPVRMFKAIAEARGLAHFSKTPGGDIDTLIGTENDIGLLSEKTTNEINEMQLGMCDQDNCHPRVNPSNQPSAKELSTSGCPGDLEIIPAPQKVVVPLNYNSPEYDWKNAISVPLPPNYNAYFTQGNNGDIGSLPGGQKALKEIVSARVCALAKEASENGYFATDAAVSGTGTIADFTPVGGSDCPLVEQESVSTGLMEKKKLVEETIAGYVELFGSPKSYCAKTRSIEVTVAFTDTNPNYAVEQGNFPTYGIRIVGNSSVFQEDSPGSPGEAGWVCVSRRELGGLSGPVNKPVACELPRPGTSLP